MHGPDFWIKNFSLTKHPEGGWFRESYRAGENIPVKGLPERFTGERPFSTAIYYLLEEGEFSAFHRIKSDEAWHHYEGGPLDIYVLDPSTRGLSVMKLGKDPGAGEAPARVVPAGSWFAARPAIGSEYTLTGCTVAPGFVFEDFEMAERDGLAKEFPEHWELIHSLTR